MLHNKIINFFGRIGAGYARFFKGILVVLIFLGIMVLFNFLIILPLRALAVSFRPVYNIITVTLIGGLLLYLLARSILRTGLLVSLCFLLFAVLLFALFLIPAKLAFVALLCTVPYLLVLFFIKKRKLMKPGMIAFLIFLCYLFSTYWLLLGLSTHRYSQWFSQWLILTIPVMIFDVFFLGLILYEKRISTKIIQ